MRRFGFANWSIIARVTSLALVFLVILISTSLYLSKKLSENGQALAESGRYISAVTTAHNATRSFGDLKYWLTDLAVSLLVRSEEEAIAAKERLEGRLAALEPYDREGVPAIRREVDALFRQAMQAVEAYTEGQRVVGNAMMAQTRARISAVDDRLSQLVATLEVRAAENRDSAIRGAEDAVDVALWLMAAALLLAVGLTLALVRSITVPLRQLTGAMSAITAGRLDTIFPERTGDEIGAMAHTLALFRDSLVERDRLAAQRERAEAEVRRAQRQLVEAIESISEGFALYDAEDRLVVCNERYRQLYAATGLDIAPGTRFADVIRSAAQSGLIPQAKERIDTWVAERLAKHHNPVEPYEQLRGNGQWLRISERRTYDGGVVGVFTDITVLKEREAALRAQQEWTAAANRRLMESIRYASRIQNAILPPEHAFALAVEDHFLIWQPRDIVGGDFFWHSQSGERHLIVIGDCTGHGVPGAFMTLIVCGLLDRITREDLDTPGAVLSRLHRELRSMLAPGDGAWWADDGLEAGACLVSRGERRLVFAGAHFSLWRGNGSEVKEIRGDRPGLGYKRLPAELRFTNVAVEPADGETFYLATDGLVDQIGGARRRPFGKRRLHEFVAAHHRRPMPEQAAILQAMLAEHQGPEARRDDVTVLGFAPFGRG